MIGSVQSWWTNNVGGPGADYGPSNLKKKAAQGAAWGAGVGALAGGAAAAHNVLSDEPYIRDISFEVPKADYYAPEAPQVFGGELTSVQQSIQSNSSDAASAELSLRYLSYLQSISPKAPVEEVMDVYGALESQFGNDEQVRSSLNLLAAHVTKHGSTPGQAYFEYQNHLHWEPDLGRAQQTFMNAHKLLPEDLNETVLSKEVAHTTRLGHLTLTQGILLGAGAGAIAGTIAGAAVGSALYLITS